MVLRHFGLREQPFGVTPDPRYLYASDGHREALSSLMYGVESGLGFVALTADPGMGKTTLLFAALQRIEDSARTVFLFQAIQSPQDLVRSILIDMGEEDRQGTLADLQTRLNDVLVAQSQTGKRLVVAIDEAQNLDDSVLEAVRMLSNFETTRYKLMQIVLCGQMQLAEKLSKPGLVQLRQRISIFARLKALSAAETAAYVEHRLRVAGYGSDKPLFTASAMKLIAKHSEGIPRNINNICFNALSLGCALGSRTIDAEVILEVLRDLDMEPAAATALPLRATAEEPAAAKSNVIRVKRTRPAVIARAAAVAALVFTGLLVSGYYALRGNAAAKVAEAAHLAKVGAAQPVQVAPAAPGNTQKTPPPGAIEMDAAEKPGASVPQPAIAGATQPVQVAPAAPANTQEAQPSKAPETAAAKQASASAPRPPAVSNGTVQTSVTPERTTMPRVRLIRVWKAQSLSSICVNAFGTCPPELLSKIVRMNPWIDDPNNVQPGQNVLLSVSYPDQSNQN